MSLRGLTFVVPEDPHVPLFPPIAESQDLVVVMAIPDLLSRRDAEQRVSPATARGHRGGHARAVNCNSWMANSFGPRAFSARERT
jgi:hypothetical protein